MYLKYSTDVERSLQIDKKMKNKANLIPDDRGRRTEDGEKNAKQSQFWHKLFYDK